MIVQQIEKCRIIPVIALSAAEDIVPLCRALDAGGLRVAEITFRTTAAREAIEIAAREFPEFILGAGTVTRIEEVVATKEAGAQFAVAPGLNPAVVEKAREVGLPFFPGVCTPSDIESALELDCTILKFFPAEAFGGLKTLRALYGPYKHRGIRLIPTGGIDASNVAAYLAHPAVLAVGGTWLVAEPLLKAKNWQEVTRLATEAVARIAPPHV